jgi:hypothetical protein
MSREVRRNPRVESRPIAHGRDWAIHPTVGWVIGGLRRHIYGGEADKESR